MFTVCPKCVLTLVVTAADLRVAQGYVRCGRCLNVFNALGRLSEERPTGAAPEPLGATPEESPQPAPPDPIAAQSPEAASTPDDTSDVGDTSDTSDTGEIEVELDAESVLVTDVRAPAAPDPGASPSAPGEIAVTEAEAPPTFVAPLPAEPETSFPAAAAVGPDTPDTPKAQETNTTPKPPEDAFKLATQRPRAGLAWTLGAGALAILLALQVVNHYRDALAANPALTRPLDAVYSALGVKLAPRWNIHAYDVRQFGAAVTGTAGEIVVRASVKNSGSRAQPLPLLRVTLQDRFGNRIAARDVPPSDYLPTSGALSSLLPAGGRVDATMEFVDPGSQAVGFEIDACLRQQNGEVDCAHGE